MAREENKLRCKIGVTSTHNVTNYENIIKKDMYVVNKDDEIKILNLSYRYSVIKYDYRSKVVKYVFLLLKDELEIRGIIFDDYLQWLLENRSVVSYIGVNKKYDTKKASSTGHKIDGTNKYFYLRGGEKEILESGIFTGHIESYFKYKGIKSKLEIKIK